MKDLLDVCGEFGETNRLYSDTGVKTCSALRRHVRNDPFVCASETMACLSRLDAWRRPSKGQGPRGPLRGRLGVDAKNRHPASRPAYRLRRGRRARVRYRAQRREVANAAAYHAPASPASSTEWS